jgi:hypothetical protein
MLAVPHLVGWPPLLVRAHTFVCCTSPLPRRPAPTMQPASVAMETVEPSMDGMPQPAIDVNQEDNAINKQLTDRQAETAAKAAAAADGRKVGGFVAAVHGWVAWSPDACDVGSVDLLPAHFVLNRSSKLACAPHCNSLCFWPHPNRPSSQLSSWSGKCSVAGHLPSSVTRMPARFACVDTGRVFVSRWVGG